MLLRHANNLATSPALGENLIIWEKSVNLNLRSTWQNIQEPLLAVLYSLRAQNQKWAALAEIGNMQWLLFVVFSKQIQVPMGDEQTSCQDYINEAERKVHTYSLGQGAESNVC